MAGSLIRAVLFDLDNTLYDEMDYVAGGFQAVAGCIAAWTGAGPAAVTDFLQAELARAGRGRVFDAALARFGLEPTPARVAELVAVYRAHRPRLNLYPDAERALIRLRPDFRLAIITDGLPAMQWAKLAALGLPARVDTIVCCWEHAAPKPDPLGFGLALERLGVAPGQALVVGDRPDHDMAPARALGCPGLRLRRGRYAGQPAGPHVADFEADSLDELGLVLAPHEESPP